MSHAPEASSRPRWPGLTLGFALGVLVGIPVGAVGLIVVLQIVAAMIALP